jgi:hypothetical protein
MQLIKFCLRSLYVKKSPRDQWSESSRRSAMQLFFKYAATDDDDEDKENRNIHTQFK